MQVVLNAVRGWLFHVLVVFIVAGLWVTASYRAMDHQKQQELADLGVVSEDELALTLQSADQRLSLVTYEQTERDWMDPT